jgi:hypothetical protein
MSLPEGYRSTFAPEEPQAEPLELLGAVLDDVGTFVRRFVVMSDAQADAVTLWIAHTHAVDAAETTPISRSPAPRSALVRRACARFWSSSSTRHCQPRTSRTQRSFAQSRS